jgi:anti-sigma regulatory factor (Ser/Thr protein kinase)
MEMPLKNIQNAVYTFHFGDDINEINQIEIIVDRINTTHSISEKVNYHLNLILEELISNMILYGFLQKSASNFIDVLIQMNQNELSIQLIDNGISFNPLEQETVNINKNLEERAIGGLGIFFVKTFAKKIKYKRINEQNHLSLLIQL